MSKHLDSLYHNLLNGKLPHNLSWSEAVELVEHLGEVQPRGDDEFVFRVGYVQDGRGQARSRRPTAPRARHFRFTRGGCLRDATHHYGAGDKRVDPHDCGPRRQADSRLRTGTV